MGGKNKKKKGKHGGSKKPTGGSSVLEGAAAVNAEMRRVALELGLEYDAEDVPQEPSRKKARVGVRENDDDDEDGPASKTLRADSPSDEEGSCDEGTGTRARFPAWLMLEPGDTSASFGASNNHIAGGIGRKSSSNNNKGAGRAEPMTPAVAAARLARLARAARLALGLPSAAGGQPRDLPVAAAVLALLGRLLSSLPPALGHKLNVGACKEAAAGAAEACARLGESLPSHPDDDDDDDDDEKNKGLPPAIAPAASKAWVETACAVDDLYYNLFYVCKVAGAGGKVPSPAEYHEAVLPPGGVPAALQHLEAARPEWSSGLANALGNLAGETKKGGATAPACCELERILRARQCEGLWLFLCTGLAETLQLKYKRRRKQGSGGGAPEQQQGAADAANRQASSGRMEEPLAPALLSRWRAAARHWPARLYAFAVPCEAALEEMSAHGPIVEVGAGTGYWASLLRLRGATVTAYDTAPPSECQWNAYHGQMPPFVSVQKGGPDALVKVQPPASLFLCYPPPGSAMARRCLDAFKGSTVLHVGEWGGMTGDAEFETKLMSDFKLAKVIKLPNWSNTCYSLTVWSRRRKGEEQAPHAPGGVLPCSQCGARVTLENGRRSALCHELVYCSQECIDDHTEARDAFARMLLIPLPHKRSHYSNLKAGSL